MVRSMKKKKTDRLKALVVEYIGNQKNNTFNYKQVSHAIGQSAPADQRTVADILAQLAETNDIIEVSPGRYKAPNRSNIITGTFVRRSNGKNGVISDADQELIFVAERNSRHALNGDRVKVNLAARRRGAEPEAQVIEIIERKPQTFVGVLQVEKHFAYLKTDSKFLANDIFIPRSNLLGGKAGDKAIAEITEWPEDVNNPKGKIIAVLGKKGDNTTEMHSILAEFGLPYSYPEAINRAAEKIDAGITDEVIASRRDMRDVTTFTIDPRDAKDFDDALSIRRLNNGHYEIGVHIADVTHYVKPDTALDREAEKRATSVYLVDRVVPMLPEHLSNGICSLRPDEDKLAFSCIFEMDEKAKIYKYDICRTVIRSNRRFTYEEAQDVIETGQGDLNKEILVLDKLAKILRSSRFENGSMDFDRIEVRFEIDEDGHPVDVFFKESKDANKLIEEFMLLANKTVAMAIGKPGPRKRPKAFVYRVHDLPDPGKLADLERMARAFGYRIKTSGDPMEVNRSINKLLVETKGTPEENLIAIMAIRAMAKAVYSTENIGHYGLGFEYYTHFTSPIRRYPDMMVHRLLDRYLNGGRSVSLDKLEEQCKHSSEMEQLAANAERSSIKYKQVEYMADNIGKIYSGIITGVMEWGLYVELEENKCEGLIPMRELADDFYELDEKNQCITGRRNGVEYRLGDHVNVRVARTNLDKKQLDFAIVDE